MGKRGGGRGRYLGNVFQSSMLTVLIQSTHIHFDKTKGDLQLHLDNFGDQKYKLGANGKYLPMSYIISLTLL